MRANCLIVVLAVVAALAVMLSSSATAVSAHGGEHWDAGPAERWRSTVEKYFDAQHVPWALRIIACQSSGDPAFETATNAGLFAHAKIYWVERATAVGFPESPPSDAVANIAAAAYVFYASNGRGGEKHWTCHYQAMPLLTPSYPRGRDKGGGAWHFRPRIRATPLSVTWS
jgi:hypothetical protein